MAIVSQLEKGTERKIEKWIRCGWPLLGLHCIWKIEFFSSVRSWSNKKLE